MFWHVRLMPSLINKMLFEGYVSATSGRRTDEAARLHRRSVVCGPGRACTGAAEGAGLSYCRRQPIRARGSHERDGEPHGLPCILPEAAPAWSYRGAELLGC